MDNLVPRYRIQSVADQTGLSTATLRAWERRYGFPSPHRTSSAYRLYSDRDVELVRRMQAMLEAGVAPGEAAQQILADSDAPEAPAASHDPFRVVADRIVEAVQRFDLGGLQHELQRALLLDSGVTVFERILKPALLGIGDGWHRGEISVAQEHMASTLIEGTASDLLRLTPIAPDAPTVLLACFADELHRMPLLGAALQLATAGLRPVLLGARTPPSAIARAVAALDPDAVGLSVTVAPEPASAARELVDAYADACGARPWIVGGAGAEALTPWIEGRGGMVAAGGAVSKALLAAVREREAKPRKTAARRR
jgi:DNA-binding transcriptional MerR regulator